MQSGKGWDEAGFRTSDVVRVSGTVDAVTLVTNSTAIGTNTLCTMDTNLEGF